MSTIKRKQDNQYILHDYFRSTIDLDTALDARHLVSVLVAIMPDLQCVFQDKQIELVNVKNHMLQRIKITWRLPV